MIKKILLLITFTIVLQATPTTTETSFDPQVSMGTDKYGNAIYQTDITIKTSNYKVENFWKKFSFGGEGQDHANFGTISKTGTVQTTVETTSACTLDDTLDKQGCSGQKPFLLNNEVLLNPINGTMDEFEVAFMEANSFLHTASNTFYPLDVLRDEKYYKEIVDGTPSPSGSAFLGFFTSSFDFIFSKTIGFGNDFFGKKDIADVNTDVRSDAAEDRRQRYIANIMAGIEKDKRMTKMLDGSPSTQINAPILNTPVSLLHYAESMKTTSTDECKFMFLNLSSDGLMCRVMDGFGMDAWMPFFNKTQTTKIESNYIMGDTENALLAMTGTIGNVPYMRDIGGNDDHKLSFLQNMLKPMKTMINTMKTAIFGTNKADLVANPVERVYTFSEDEAMTMTFAITNDGTEVNDFANFKLLKIRSVYGDKVTSCKVKKTFSVMGFKKTLWEEVFYEEISKTKDGKNNEEWIDWCQEQIGTKGIFDYLTDWSTGGLFNPINWFLSFLSLFGVGYEITDFTNAIGRGLILDLKKVEVINPLSPRNTSTYKLMRTK